MLLDPRLPLLAKNLIGFSVNMKKGERVLIDAQDVPREIVIALIQAARAKKAIPFVNLQDQRISRELFINGSEEQFGTARKWMLEQMKSMDAYIALRGSENIFESSDVPPKAMVGVMKALRPVLDWRIKKTRWCVLRWPTSAMAQQALMSTEAFEDFYFKVCTLDYSRMKAGMGALKRLMDKTDRVHIKGPETDLRFSIKGIGSIACGGTHNIPDGEVFSCPVKDSVEGVITHNAPTVYQGVSFDNIRLRFEKGKIVEATSNNTKRLNQILDSDEGARYIGEFAIGFNPYILEPMRDILFDEKIAGSFHFTPGQAYEDADNGNNSQVHWDMVSIQRKDWGGGEIWFDGKLIRKDGIFIPKSLEKLNPDYLKG
ncbi:MAG: aminopeptidase [Verrucomicrobiota bacterium]